MIGLPLRFALVAALIPVLCIARTAQAKPPSQATVRSWLMPEEKVKFDEPGRRIVMRNGEVAYLISATLTEAGRNFSHAIVLARPKEKSAQFLVAENATLGAIHDSGSKGVSLVEIISYGSGQGTSASTKSLTLFDGAEQVDLHWAGEEENLGSCGQEVAQKDCYSTEVNWELRDLDHDGVRDLVETTISRKGAEREAMSSTTVVKRYRMKDWKLVAERPQR
jgi:hypothetical protein